MTSYGTRVEYAHKEGSTWTLHLRKLERYPELNKIRAKWWTEEFDAVIVAIDWDAVHVPNIKGLAGEWSEAKENGKHSVWHSQAYRRPESLVNKVNLYSLVVFIGPSSVDLVTDYPHCRRLDLRG